MSKSIIYLSLAVLLFASCTMNEPPITSADKGAIFSSEEGLEAYSISFYDMLPSATDQAIIEQSLVDYGATNTLSPFITRNAYSENNSSGWDWDDLRNVNYFIVNCNDPRVTQEVRNNYLGIARFFRAWFYYDKVRRFGDVPWINHPLDPSEEKLLYGTRDPRGVVMDSVYSDLMFAAKNITRTDDSKQCTLITKWAAYAFASRIALFEGTYEKYHDIQSNVSAETWLQRAADAAEEVMKNSGKSLHGNYRELFTSDDPPTDETILAIASDEALGVMSQVNWRWASETYGTGMNLIRPFVCTYLQKDGTPYTDRPGWQHEDFYEEFQNRDDRLSASLRYPGYKREGNLTLPVFDGYARLGYQPMKLMVDATNGDDKSVSTQAVQLIRYGEVLLNDAEAKAELGTLTDHDWAITIGALRARAGITGGLNAMPTKVDSYLRNTYFPNISDPVLLEIRRERAIELLLEGFRFDDLRRWEVGNLFKMSWTGMYIEDVNTPLDVDHNGTDDVVYYTDDSGLQNALSHSNNADMMKVKVSKDPSASIIQVHAAPNGAGYYLAWFTNNDSKKVWGSKQYLYPIPVEALNKNENLEQNPGWENGATNDGN